MFHKALLTVCGDSDVQTCSHINLRPCSLTLNKIIEYTFYEFTRVHFSLLFSPPCAYIHFSTLVLKWNKCNLLEPVTLVHLLRITVPSFNLSMFFVSQAILDALSLTSVHCPGRTHACVQFVHVCCFICEDCGRGPWSLWNMHVS